MILSAFIRRRALRLLLTLALFTSLFSFPAHAARLSVNLNSNRGQIMTLGKTIKLKAEASGGSRFQYRFIVQYNGRKKTLKNYGGSNTLTYKPKMEGTYYFYVTVRNNRKQKVTTRLSVQVQTPATRAELKARNKVLNIAKSWMGTREHSPKHLEILSIYNRVPHNIRRDYISGNGFVYSHYNVSSYDAWCDTFVSAVFLKAGLSHLTGVECACGYHILLLKSMGRYIENDAYVPKPGDIIFYDWDDSGIGDCTGWSDHVGIVAEVNGNMIKTIEGNYKDSVASRTIGVNSRFICGYGIPDYASLV